mgnify:CR=1 FL=1
MQNAKCKIILERIVKLVNLRRRHSKLPILSNLTKSPNLPLTSLVSGHKKATAKGDRIVKKCTIRTICFPNFLSLSKISFYSKEELVYKNLFECRYVILFVEHKHSFFVINRIYTSERYWAIVVCNQNTVANNTCSSFVPICKSLNV